MAARRHAAQARGREVAFTVWQFVRVMVRLEETSRRGGDRPRDRLYEEWRSSWEEVDKELTRLGKSDPDAFSDLMMDHDVVVTCEAGAQLSQLLQVIDEVVGQLSKAIAAREGGPEQLQHLKFERGELGKLKKRIAPRTRKQPKR